MQTLIRYDRDLRIDFFRGIALWCIFIDHLMIGNLRLITLKQYGFCDAAEWFILLSGILAGIAYERSWRRDGLLSARLKIARRAFAIYRTHVVVYLLFLLVVGIVMGLLHPGGFLGMLYLSQPGARSVPGIVNAILLRDSPGSSTFFRSMSFFCSCFALFSLWCAARDCSWADRSHCMWRRILFISR